MDYHELIHTKINEVRSFSIELFESTTIKQAVDLSLLLCESINVAIDQLVIAYIAESDYSKSIKEDKLIEYFEDIKKSFDKRMYWSKRTREAYKELISQSEQPRKNEDA